MPNFFDRFDMPEPPAGTPRPVPETTSGNFFDQFDEQPKTAPTSSGFEKVAIDFGSGLIAGLASIPEALATAIPGPMQSNQYLRNSGFAAPPPVDIPGVLERNGMNAPMPTDTVGRATYNFGRNIGGSAPFAPLVGAAPVLLGSAGATIGGETAHAIAPNSQIAETIGSLAGGILAAPGAARSVKGGSTPPKRLGPAPTNEMLREQAQAAYQRADDAGVIVAPEGMQRLRSAIDQDISEIGFDPALQPRVTVVLKRLDEATSGPVTLKHVDLIRRIAQNAAQSADPSERKIGSTLIDNIDNFLSDLQPTDVLGGDTATASRSLLEARSLWRRLRKSELLDEAVNNADLRASSTGSGGNADNAVRQNIRAILTNPKKRRAFTKEEQFAMERVVRGGRIQNLLRLVGKLSPQGSGLMGSIGTVSAIANPVAGIPFAAGLVAKPIADAITVRNVNRLSEQVRRGPQ